MSNKADKILKKNSIAKIEGREIDIFRKHKK
jgi:hypothetical protein